MPKNISRHCQKEANDVTQPKISEYTKQLTAELKIAEVVKLSELKINLDNAQSIEIALKKYEDETPRLFVLEDFQDIPDPRMLLRKLRALLKLKHSSRLIIATKSHSKIIQPQQALADYFEHSGFVVQKADYPNRVVVSADEQSHQKILKSHGLPAPKPTLIITTEHASQSYSGGIGAYIEQVEALMGNDSPIILYCGATAFDDSSYKLGNVVDISKVSDVEEFDKLNVNQQSQTVYQATLRLLFYYDQVVNIEYQDFRGIGADIAQAKQSGEIPTTIQLIAHCHSSVAFIVYITQKQLNVAGVKVDMLEKLSIQHADRVLFPTKYLKNMYLQLSYNLVEPKKKVEIRRLPYKYVDKPPVEYQTITNIAFFGRREAKKGYDDFCKMIVNIVNPESPYFLPQISSITAIGGDSESKQLDTELAEYLKSRGIALDMRVLNHSKAMQAIDKLAPFTLFCLPYKADNHPMALIEMIAHGCDFVAYNCGGIPEMIPANLHKQFLCDPSWQILAKQVYHHATQPQKQRAKTIKTLYKQATAEQQKINSTNIL